MNDLSLFNSFNKQLFNNTTQMFDDIFDGFLDNWSKVKTFPFYNVVKYGKGKYGLELGLAGYNKENIIVELKDGILTVQGEVKDKKNIEYDGKGKYGLELGLAGYNKENIIVELKDGILTVQGEVKDKKNIEYVLRGLALRKFYRQFSFPIDAIIDEAEMKDGILTIKFGLNDPKDIEGVKIDIK